jgi:hypothetical protein
VAVLCNHEQKKVLAIPHQTSIVPYPDKEDNDVS